jgi:Zn-dependent alcohol dehydrogenase
VTVRERPPSWRLQRGLHAEKSRDLTVPYEVKGVVARSKGPPSASRRSSSPIPSPGRRWSTCTPAGSATPICTTRRGINDDFPFLLGHEAAGTVSAVGRCPDPRDMTIELPLIEIFGRGGALKSSWYGDYLPSRDFPMLIDLHL